MALPRPNRFFQAPEERPGDSTTPETWGNPNPRQPYNAVIDMAQTKTRDVIILQGYQDGKRILSDGQGEFLGRVLCNFRLAGRFAVILKGGDDFFYTPANSDSLGCPHLCNCYQRYRSIVIRGHWIIDPLIVLRLANARRLAWENLATSSTTTLGLCQTPRFWHTPNRRLRRQCCLEPSETVTGSAPNLRNADGIAPAVGLSDRVAARLG